jgi:hypothetical protein
VIASLNPLGQRSDGIPDKDGVMITWEYTIVALPRFDAPTATRGTDGSPAVALLNGEGRLGWEAVGMTALQDGTVAVLLKRPVGDRAPGSPNDV